MPAATVHQACSGLAAGDADVGRVGLFGTTGFFFGQPGEPWLMSFFLFQMMFCGTVATIISGVVAERIRFAGYLLATIVLAGVIYPVVGHWTWGGAESGAASGWLTGRGFIDLAGTMVADSVDGSVTVEGECDKGLTFAITRLMHHVAPPCEAYDDRLEDAPDERIFGSGAA